MEAAVFVDGKQAVKKAQWSLAVAPTAKVGFHFTMEPQEDPSVQGLVEGGRGEASHEAMGSGAEDHGLGRPDSSEAASELSASVSRRVRDDGASDTPVQNAVRSSPVSTPATLPVLPGSAGDAVMPTVVDLNSTPS